MKLSHPQANKQTTLQERESESKKGENNKLTECSMPQATCNKQKTKKDNLTEHCRLQ